MNTIREHIKNRTFLRCYLLCGTDDYMIRLYKQKLKTAVVGEEESMNLNAFEEGEKDPLEIRDLAITAPFFAEKRMIIISDSGWFKGNHLFAEFLPELPDTTVVLFTEAEPDKSSALYKAVKEIGHVAEMNGLTDEDLMMFIGSGFKKRGLGISGSTASLLLERTGRDMNRISQEIDKLSAYCIDKGEVRAEDVFALTAPVIEGQVFAMMDAVLDGDRKKAISLYGELLAAQEKPLRILYMLTNNFFSFYKVLALDDEGVKADDIAARLSLRPFVVKKYLRRKRAWKFSTVLSAIEEGNEAERLVKSGNLGEHEAVEMFLIKYSEEKERQRR